MARSEDFDRYVAENEISDEELPEAFAHRLQEQNGGRPVQWGKVEPGEEEILPPREQRELDGVDSLLARRYEED